MWGSREISSQIRGSPPWAAIISFSLFRPAPLATAFSSRARASSSVSARPVAISIRAPRNRDTFFSGPPVRPASTSTASFTSRALPTWLPRGSSMPDTTAVTLRPARRPMSTMALASSTEASSVGISAPEPVFTSSTMALEPPANFLLNMLDTIRGTLSTVAVTSRRA